MSGDSIEKTTVETAYLRYSDTRSHAGSAPGRLSEDAAVQPSVRARSSMLLSGPFETFRPALNMSAHQGSREAVTAAPNRRPARSAFA